MAEVERTREFIPNDIIEPSLSERVQLIDARLNELRKKRDSFDPETQFVGIKRLGSQYTVAEPFAYFDGPSQHQLRYNRVTINGLSYLLGTGAITWFYKSKGVPYGVSLLRGIVCAVPIGFISSWIYEYSLKLGQKKENVFFSYALIHEKDFPVIERKKYDQVIQDYTAHRSMNMPVLGYRW